MRFGFPCFAVALAASVLLSTGDAHAQQWLSDRQRAEGRGIRLGDFELHPGIGAEIGWISNVFLANTQPEASGVLRVAPHLYLSTLGADRMEGQQQKVSFRTGASGTFKDYFATAYKPNPDIGAGQDARLVLSPSRVFRAEFFDEYRRSIDPFTQVSPPTLTNGPGVSGTPMSGGTVGQNFDRDQLGVGTRLQVSTPGELFKAGVGYRFDVDHFESSAFAGNRNHYHSISADTSWEFLPKTALVWQGAVRLHKYATPSPATSTAGGMTGGGVARYDSTNVDSKLGINGALTERIGFTIAGGYGAGFFSNNYDYESVIAQVEARFKLQENLLWALGYDRLFNPAFQGNFARVDRIKTRLQAMAFGALLIALRGELSFVAFGQDPLLGPRNDKYLLTNLSGEYRVVDWLAITAEVGYIHNFTSYQFPALMAGGPLGPKAEYGQFATWFGLRAFL